MQVLRYDTLDSTNAEAKRQLAVQQAHVQPILVRANCQTAGRGTHGRQWCSPAGAGVYLSLASRVDQQATPQLRAMTLAAGVACVQAIHEATGLSLLLKPINDIVSDQGKVGGILCESIIVENQACAVIVGVGINTRDVAREIDNDGLEVASLDALLEGPQTTDHDVLVEAVASQLVVWLNCVLDGNLQHVCHAWNEHRVPTAEAVEWRT